MDNGGFKASNPGKDAAGANAGLYNSEPRP